MKWQSASFLRATSRGPETVSGYQCGGLGLYDNFLGEEWCLVHVNSGLAIAWIDGPMATAKRIGKGFVALTDWASFTGPDDWQKLDAELPRKVQRECENSDGRAFRKGMRPEDGAAARKMAKRVIAARSATPPTPEE